MDKKYGIANTKEFGLIEGEKYLIENPHTGSAYVYNMKGEYVTYCRLDSFDNLTGV